MVYTDLSCCAFIDEQTTGGLRRGAARALPMPIKYARGS